jgi:Raf kinase inhibitor-like YbhB/YbcL family protein
MATATISLSSTAFEHEGLIPEKFTCDGDNVNPPLTIGLLPDGTKTLALIFEDPDAPMGIYDHWVVWNIAPTDIIKENSMPGISGMNSSGKTGYTGPCPPDKEHRYFFYLFALDTDLDLPEVSNKGDLSSAIVNHILGEGILMGRYDRKH